MIISTRNAREIRRGITLAKNVLAGRRRSPRMTPFGFRGAPEPQLWERGYYHEFRKAIRDGRLKPPRGGSGGSDAA